MKNAMAVIILIILCGVAIAATTTTNYSLYKPAIGDKNWGTQINQNFDTIDTEIKAVDTKADLKANTSDVTTLLADKVDTADVGVANGVASLNSSGKVPDSQLPASLSGALVYKGALDASGGTYPAAVAGDYYIVSVLGTIEGTDYTVGDWATYNGSAWSKIDNTQAVVSVNGADGIVVLDTGDIAEATDANYVSDAQLVVIGNTSGTNTGNQDLSGYAPLASPTFTGTVTGTFAGNVTGNVTGNLTGNVTGNVTGSSGSTTGNAATATAFAANPTDCAVNQYATTIAANGNLTCSTPAGSISGLTTNYLAKASSATAIANSSILDNGSAISTSLNITAPTFIGALTGNASTATALAANGTNCSAGQAAQGVDASGNAESCFAPGGWSTDNSTKVTTTYNVGIGVASPTEALDVDGNIYSRGNITLDGSIYGDGANLTNVSGVDLSAVDQGIYPATTTTYDIGSATYAWNAVYTESLSITGTSERWAGNTYPANLIDFNDSATAVTIEPGIISPRVTPTAGTTITATGNLTIAQIGAASFFPVDTTGGAITLTLYSDAIDNGIPATDVGRLIRIAVVAGGTNAVTLALDANLTFVPIDGTEAVEDVGDYIECHIITTDIVSCVAIEAD